MSKQKNETGMSTLQAAVEERAKRDVAKMLAHVVAEANTAMHDAIGEMDLALGDPKYSDGLSVIRNAAYGHVVSRMSHNHHTPEEYLEKTEEGRALVAFAVDYYTKRLIEQGLK